jgi:iron complex outermembrane receptor protein
LSAEARYQEDKVVEGNLGGTPLEETFTSNNPRVILDFEVTEDTMLYASFAQGSQPGQFNASLLGRTQDELDQIAAQGGGGIAVDEEEVTNIEFGVKSLFWDSRAQISAAVYFMDWDSIVAAEIIPIINADGEPENVQVNSTGGQADLSGLELEGTVVLSENWTLDGTLSIVKADIGDFESPDALRLLGDRTIDTFGNVFSRYPEESGTLSLTYQNNVTTEHQFFARSDVIYRGENWMTNANVSEVGAVTTVNLRLGVETDAYRIEAYGANIFDEEGYTATQFFPDLSGISGGRMIFASFLPRATYGVRASFFF